MFVTVSKKYLTFSGLVIVTLSMVVVGAIFPSDGRLELQKDQIFITEQWIDHTLSFKNKNNPKIIPRMENCALPKFTQCYDWNTWEKN